MRFFLLFLRDQFLFVFFFPTERNMWRGVGVAEYRKKIAKIGAKMSNETDARSKPPSTSGSRRKHRSRSTPRHAELEKPRKKRHLSATNSLVSIPNTIKLSMMNSGLLSTSEYLKKHTNDGLFLFFFFSLTRKIFKPQESPKSCLEYLKAANWNVNVCAAGRERAKERERERKSVCVRARETERERKKGMLERAMVF